jgi:WD40 repeat protein
MQLVSELTENIGLIKAIAISKERKVLMAALEKSILVWDLVGLTKIGEFRGYNEIKCLEIVGGDTVFAGTKGGPTTSALLIFDLRKSYVTTMDEKEKNQDIFCLKATKDWLFMGCRNHEVKPLNLKTLQTLNPLQPPHLDAVTCLSVINGTTLVSGSKDKILRSYEITNSSFEKRISI